MNNPPRFFVLPACALLSGLACMREGKNAWADSLAADPSPARLQQAVRLSPDDAAKWRLLGVALLHERSDFAIPALKRASDLNAFDADARLGLAVEEERRGQTASAENYYREAALVSRRFKPHAALAGFYFRSARLPEFWKAASAAAGITAADITPVIELAHQTGVTPNRVPGLLALKSAHAQTIYLNYAASHSLLDEAAAAAKSLPVTEDSGSLLLNTCDLLISSGRTRDAVEVWNRLTQAGITGLESLNPAKGRSLTNSTFRLLPVSGFNWRIADLPGVTVRPAAQSGLAIEFSGDQPEFAFVLHQTVPVLPGREYRLRLQYQTADLTGNTGLAIQWEPACGTTTGSMADTQLAPSDSGTVVSQWRAPAGCEAVKVSLRYHRAPGTVRIHGALALQSAELEVLP